MTTITLKVSEADKNFLKAMAKFEGISLSELIAPRHWRLWKMNMMLVWGN